MTPLALYFLGSILGSILSFGATLIWVKRGSDIKAWFKSWNKPGKPIETFFDDEPKKMGSGDFNVLKPTIELDAKTEQRLFWLTEQRLFWLEQEAKRHQTMDAAARFAKMERSMDSLNAELSEAMTAVKALRGTVEHLIKTKTSEENFSDLQREVNRVRTDLSLASANVKKLQDSVIPFEKAAVLEITKQRLDGQHSQHMNSIEAILRRIETLERTKPTDEQKLQHFVKLSADVKQLALYEVREAARQYVDSAKSELAQDILKKFAAEVQETFDKRYVVAKSLPTPPKVKPKKATPKIQAVKVLDKPQS